jgi:hypothetical protein
MIKKLIDESPSLKAYPKKQLGSEFEFAKVKAIDETGLSEEDFPADCPYAIADVLNSEFFPGTPWSRERLIRK